MENADIILVAAFLVVGIVGMVAGWVYGLVSQRKLIGDLRAEVSRERTDKIDYRNKLEDYQKKLTDSEAANA